MRVLAFLLAVFPAAVGASLRPSTGVGAPADAVSPGPAGADTTATFPSSSDTLRLRLGLQRLALPFTIDWPPVPGRDDPFLTPPTPSAVAVQAFVDRHPWSPTLRLRPPAPPAFAGGGGEAAPGAPRSASDTVPAARPGEEPGFMDAYTDLGMRVVARSELGGDWTRYRPCDDRFQEACNPRLLPQLNPDLRFGVQVGGSISNRIHVDVDFDQMREFDAANRINLYYEGGPDDIVHRLELGDVTFRLPRSRFVTEGIPAGNFGFQATGQLGPVDFQAVWAEQRGDLSSREFRLTGVGGRRGFVQEDTLVLDDADYAQGQFFFLVDPTTLEDYPHVDPLALDGSEAAPGTAPGLEPVQVYRFENDPVQRQQVEGYIQAEAVAVQGADTVREAGWFRYLQPGVDYFVHPSGLWIALKNPLSRDEMLAVTYVTAAGDTVGDYNPERIQVAGGRPKLRLLKASGANHQPGRPTWKQEMHDVYRVSGSSDVEPGSVDLTISLGERSAGRTFARGPRGEDVTYLRLFGLDEESPLDEIDPSHVYQPGRDDASGFGQPAVQGTFVVFPTLEPFKTPPPLPSLGLSAEDTKRILGTEANTRIYDAADPFERENGGLFRLTLPYRVRSQDVISSFSLGALGIRDGSEHIYLAGRLLTRGVDYAIDYDVGQVTLLDPETLFAANPDATVRATWEQKQVFQTAPTQVFGASAHWDLGGRGGIDLLGLWRGEKTLALRPGLGVEPGAIGLGGLSGNWAAPVTWLDRALDRVPGLRTAGGSSLSVDGEVALSMPNPNTRGEVFLDDFDATDALPLSLLARDWQLGSAPSSTAGAERWLPATLDATTAAPLTWQHAWVQESPVGDSVGVHDGFIARSEIDHQIRVAGSQIKEPGLRLTFAEGGSQRRWRSITTVLSPTGTDLTRSDYLEFYASGQDATLVLDLGVVSEDAFFVDAQGLTSGMKDGKPWGLGVLDQEADPSRGEIWNDALDKAGLWNEACMAERAALYRLGDPRANCTRGNGRRDSEDLDGNGVLDTREHHLRYVVELGPLSPYLARTTEETGTPFRLYRIPIQGPDAIQVGGAFTESDLRAVKQLRITVAADGRRSITLARLRVTGSRWLKRGGDGVLQGMVGDTAALGGRLEVAEVSKVTDGGAYQSPPGVLEQLSDPTQALGGQGVEFNEKSLGLRFQELEPGQRVEVYSRFPQRPRNLLTYGQARLWVVPRSGDFGADRPHWFFFKVGSDADNFYLYRTRLHAPSNPAGVTREDWAPEVLVDFGQWLDLRRQAEEELIRHPRTPDDPPVTVWSADSTYAVVLKDRGRGPDLANVRELAVGVWNDGVRAMDGEVWIDELRLASPRKTPGFAGHFDLDLNAGGVLDTRVTLTGRGAQFHQLAEDPTYQTDQLLSVASTLHLDRFAPAEWGVDLPLTLSHDRATEDPTFLANSDVRADRLPGLRPTGARQTRVSLGFRKRTPSANPLVGALLDGLDARLDWYRASSGTVTSDQSSQGVDAHLGYTRLLENRDFGLIPGFLAPVVRFLLPSSLEDPVVNARFRWSPERVTLGTTYQRLAHETRRYDRIIEVPEDAFVLPTEAPRKGLQSVAELAVQPLPFLTGDASFLSTRDLLAPEDAVADPAVQDLLREQRARLGGTDLGWETSRDLSTRVRLAPRIFPWLRHDVTWTTHYLSDRSASFVERRVLDGDTLLALQRSADGRRQTRANASLDPALMATDLLGWDQGVQGLLPGLLRVLRPLSFTWQSGLSSRFHRDPVNPGLGFQLGLGSLEDFRVLAGDTAATLTDQTQWTLGSGVVLPMGVSVDVGYARGRIGVLDTRSDRTITSETWPDVRAGVGGVAPPGAFGRVLRSVNLSSGFQRTVRETASGGLGQQLRTDRDVQVPVDVTLAWAGDLVTSYRGAFRAGKGADPTGDTDRRLASHRLAVTASLLPPPWAPFRMEQPMRVSLIYTYTGERDCRAPTGVETCVAYLDRLDRSLGVTMDTRVSNVQVGLQASYTDRASFVGLHTGSTRFQLGVFGQFLFEAGDIPVRGAPGPGGH